MDNIEFNLGYKPSQKDHRDYIYGACVDMAAVDSLPAAFSLPDIPIRDQGDKGTCVGHAAAYLKDYQEMKNSPGVKFDFSPLFIYEECKKLDGNVEEGTTPRNAMKVLQTIGGCLEATLPYSQLQDVNKLPTPSQQAYTEAKEYLIKSYARVQTVDEIKHAIYSGSPVVAGVLVASNFVNCEPGGMIDTPDGQILGGHGIAIIGWDDNKTYTFKNGNTRKGFVKFINSWKYKDGTPWGDKGFGWLCYDFITGHMADMPVAYMSEAWSSVDVIGPIHKPQPTPNPVPPAPTPKPIPTPQPTPQPQPSPTPAQGVKVEMWINNQEFFVNGQKYIMPIAPDDTTGFGRTLIKPVFEALGFSVDWNTDTDKITLIHG